MTLAQALAAGGLSGVAGIQPVAVLTTAAALYWYLRRASVPARWPRRRTVYFVGGLALLLVVSCGPVAHYAASIYWVWVSQSLMLLLVVPVPLICGQPIELARTADPASKLAALLDSTAGRWFSSPLVGPALVPLVCIATLFGPVPGWAAGTPGAGWLIQLLLVLLGAIVVLPLVAWEDQASSVAVGAAVAVGFVELLIDAVPGIVLRLSTHPVSGFFAHRTPIAATPPWLHDQQIGGGVLWCVAELLDLPFLLLVFRRWLRADAREAAVIDAALDERDRAELTGSEQSAGDQPWFLNDPRLRDRLR